MSDNKQEEHLKNETAPAAPELHPDSAVHKKAKVNKPWVAALARFSRPLAAIVVIIGIVSVGYYGFVRSSADTNSYVEPTCQHENSQACADKRAKALADVKAACKDAGMDYNPSTQSCSAKDCLAGFERVNGQCKEKDQPNCRGLNREKDGKYDCGGCLAGFAENAQKNCQAKVDCSAIGQLQKDDFTCNGCLKNYARDPANNCKKIADCDAQHLVAGDTQFTCGSACTSGYSMKDGKGLCFADTVLANLCALEFRAFNTTTNDCNTCLVGYKIESGKCVKDSTVVLTVNDCNALHRTFNPTTKKCGNCVGGYQVNDANVCLPQSGAALTCPAGKVIVDNKCVDSVESSCDGQHKQYNREKNICKDACQAGYYVSNTANHTTVCQSPTHVSEDPAVKGTCDAAHLVYNKLTNACTTTCVDGYTMQLKTKLCNPVPSNIENCKRDVNGRCTANVTAVKAACAGQYREYNENTNTCRNSCIDGYYSRDGVCKETGIGKPAAVKAGCEKLNLTYDAEANICKPNCKSTYIMKDGACIPWEDAGMNVTRCNALGRIWVPGTPATADAAAVPGSCSTNCKSLGTTQVVTGNLDTQYCQNPAGVGGIGGVTTTMTKEQCQAEDRAWLEAIPGCSSRCKTDYFFSVEKSKCVPIIPAIDPLLQGSGEAISDDGTCSVDTQQMSFINNQGKLVTILVCPDDVGESEDTTVVDDGRAVAHNVDTTLSHEACRLLGREWVPNEKDEDGTITYGGCSTSKQGCLNDNLNIVPNNNDDVPYCPGSVDSIGKKMCVEELHRIWSRLAGGCLANLNSDNADPNQNAPQCQPPYTVYIQHTIAQGGLDECVTPTAYERLKGVAESAGRGIGFVTTLPAAGVCNLRPGMAWDSDKGRCEKARVPKGDKNQGGGGGGDTTTPPATPPGPPNPTEASCGALGRTLAQDGTKCGGCKNPDKQHLVGNECVDKPTAGDCAKLGRTLANGECGGCKNTITQYLVNNTCVDKPTKQDDFGQTYYPMNIGPGHEINVGCATIRNLKPEVACRSTLEANGMSPQAIARTYNCGSVTIAVGSAMDVKLYHSSADVCRLKA